MMRSFRKVCLAGALTMAACGAAVPAVAADNDAVVPDASRQATLDIHKLSGTESTTRADGTALAPEEVAKYGKPMGGVVFDVYTVSGRFMSVRLLLLTWQPGRLLLMVRTMLWSRRLSP